VTSRGIRAAICARRGAGDVVERGARGIHGCDNSRHAGDYVDDLLYAFYNG
jgi:hypothetical protein